MSSPASTLRDDRIISAAITTEALVPTRVNVADLSASLQHFGFVDYLVFVLMLLVCAFIGFYFGFIERKKKKQQQGTQRRNSEALEYLVGGRKMKVIPVSLSLVASFISGISLLGSSTEVYVYGTQYAFVLVTIVFSGIISWYVFLPVFCNLQLTSTYEIMWLPIVIYVPALAFNQVTGVNIHIVTPVVCVVCIFYTCVGGLKAVVWTDVIQTVVMVGTILFISIKGTIDVGGLQVVWQRNMNSGRIELPKATWDPTVRASLISVFCGTTLHYVLLSAGNQNIVQRYLSLPSLREVGQALCLFTIGNVLLSAVCFYNGLLIYATYYNCDPLSTKLAKAKDQLVPLYVMDVIGHLPVIPGVFVASVFSAALSSLSTGLNSLATVFLEDYVKTLYRTQLSERQTVYVLRLSVVLFGIISVALVFVVEKLGTVLQISMALSSITTGPLLGLFLMGLLLPWINGKSALVGSSVAFIIMMWICAKAQIALATGELVYPIKPVSTEGCNYIYELTTLNATTSENIIEPSERTFLQNIYHMSFMFYACVGCTLTITMSMLMSFIYGFNKPSEMNVYLFAPFIRTYIKSADNLNTSSEEKISMIESSPARQTVVA